MGLERWVMGFGGAAVAGAVGIFAMKSCIVPAPSDEKGAEKTRVISAATQPATVKIGANLSDKIFLLGAQLMPAHASTTDPMQVSLVFQTKTPMEEDENIFVHVEDAESGTQLANIDHAPSAGPTSTWKVGEIRKDDFQVTLPAAAAQVKGINLWVGLWNPKNDARMQVVNADQVPNDGRSRIRIGPIPAGGM